MKAEPHSTRVSHGLELTKPISIRARAGTIGRPVPPRFPEIRNFGLRKAKCLLM